MTRECIRVVSHALSLDDRPYEICKLFIVTWPTCPSLVCGQDQYHWVFMYWAKLVRKQEGYSPQCHTLHISLSPVGWPNRHPLRFLNGHATVTRSNCLFPGSPVPGSSKNGCQQWWYFKCWTTKGTVYRQRQPWDDWNYGIRSWSRLWDSTNGEWPKKKPLYRSSVGVDIIAGLLDFCLIHQTDENRPHFRASALSFPAANAVLFSSHDLLWRPFPLSDADHKISGSSWPDRRIGDML